MKKTRLLSVALCGMCAAIWTVNVVIWIVKRLYEDSMPVFLLNVVCSAIWVGAFIVNWMRYRNEQGK